MKKLLLSIIVLLCLGKSSAQDIFTYKPLTAFSKDTTAFLMYNFMDRTDYYKGKTLKEVLTDLELPIKEFTYSYDNKHSILRGVYIYTYPIDYVDKLNDKKKDINVLYVAWEDVKIPKKEVLENSKAGWQKEYEEYKDLKIKDIYVIMPLESKYYNKYYKEGSVYQRR